MKGSLGEEDEMRSLKVAVTLENRRDVMRDEGTLLKLPPCCPVRPSDPISSSGFLPFPSFSCPETFVTPNVCFFPSAPSFSSSSLPSSPSNLGLLSVRQDKLSEEEVQKQHDGPEENGSPPATHPEPDGGPNANPDASRAEEDKDKTKPLLERLKALEVTTMPFFFSFFLLWLPLSLPFFLLCSSSSPLASLSASLLCSLVSESMTAHHILQYSFVRRRKSSYESGGWASGFTPAALFSSALRDLRWSTLVFTEAAGHTSSQISSAINALRLN